MKKFPVNGGALGPEAREASIQRLRATADPGQELDILIVGGGIVGTGAALDAVTRGLSVGIVEANDWAAGTSSRSSKLIHGGLRYLEMLDFGLVKEALQERGLLLSELAPHLARPVPFLYPLTKPFIERPYVGAGIALYDAMSVSSGHSRGVPFHKHLSRRGTLRAAPSLKNDAFVGSIRYYDGQVDDAKYCANLVRTAAYYGAHAVNQMKVVDFLREGERVVGAKVVNHEDGTQFNIRAKQVINATGVWTDETQAMVTDRGQLKVRASKGIHLVVPRDRFQSTVGLILRTEKSVLFVIPWGRHWIIGTTDTDWNLDKAHPAASSKDIDYILEHVNKVLKRPLTREDVEGVYAGLRPLLAGENDSTAKLSREHVVAHPVPGLVVVAGGKWTTYRVMAKDAVDEATRTMDERVPPSCTETIPLLGASGFRAAWNRRNRTAEESGVHVARIEHLLNRYGSMTSEVLSIIEENPALAEPLPGADDYLQAEAVYAATHEGARHVHDVLTRRTRISIEAWDRGVSAVPVVAKLMGDVLGWSDAQRENEVRHYIARVEAERLSQQQPDDESADAARLGVEDIVPLR
ncbi:MULTISPECIES: glycerol-3-phosphate dehydrogenase/oxidase [Pseudarthrobacter]|jgi:glycerol-3-phosphate dehydrogenase|uniref:Glycerol-3-phosphate dehydrogenase n=1 Tax=Pseudarthrobacter oxydans TaxID=1671 RepID=A0AAW8N3K9_PSEOX|nr:MULTISPECIES: glycerol-3-phosphate dehydrogenase/oxidase [Pseudarthrobacter]MDV2977200.1 glycerol-3-phosphate dehydrogenase/oxidase [Actinomycetes bacterium ARC8]WHP58129.1 glycerol-3-phosphate dehydrogenase/oxidase [Arthrobacter sp. KFRI-F3372]MDR6792546.1 glycerol-3-phosphate dehydrogenase [Pseudarthrobacter oxydans]MDR7162277.1 glycerol-3-phosphate dehydrogenase [Pseudarthrobacter oxydans]NSX36027.1 glycerol-3-phosphate dehydrogenase/oxidase [Pseudarthrobacter oxydans]